MCMLQPSKNGKEKSSLKKILVMTVSSCLATVLRLFISLRVRRYISGICPNGRMAAIGKYRRNLIDFEENSRYILFWAIYASSVVTLRKTAMMFPEISPVTIYRIGHGTALVFIWLFHGLLLPLSMKIPWKSKHPRKASQFYVQKPVLLPLDLPPPPPPPLSPPPPRTNSFLTSGQDWFRSPSPTSPPIRPHSNRFIWPQQERSHPIGEETLLKTLYYSSRLYRPAKPEVAKSKEKKGTVGLNAVLMTALKFQQTGATSLEKDIYLKPFKCEVCKFECETNVTLQKHKNNKHKISLNATDQKQDVQEATETPNSGNSCLKCGHKERKETLKTTDTKDPMNKWYQIGIQYKRQRQASPLYVNNDDVHSVHSPPPQLPVPSSITPESPAQATRERQDVAEFTNTTNAVQYFRKETHKRDLPLVE